MGDCPAGAVAWRSFGPLDAGNLPDSTRVRMLIRPEGLRVSPATPGQGRVVTARLLGRCSHLRIAVAGAPELLQALVPGVVLPEEGSLVAIEIDADQSFVFADE